MSLYITAQLVGFLGYLFLTASPSFKNQYHTIKMDVLACVFLSLQWFLLDQPCLLALNILNITVSLSALHAANNARTQKAMLLFYPFGIAVLGLLGILSGGNNVITTFCIIGFCAIVSSKKAQDSRTFRKYAMLSTMAFTASGALALSLPAILFNTLRFSLHAYRLHELTSIRLKYMSI